MGECDNQNSDTVNLALLVVSKGMINILNGPTLQ